MNEKLTPEQLRAPLEKLFQDAGYTVPELLDGIESLLSENEKLKQELKKLRLASARSTASGDRMNSRLKDALRE